MSINYSVMSDLIKNANDIYILKKRKQLIVNPAIMNLDLFLYQKQFWLTKKSVLCAGNSKINEIRPTAIVIFSKANLFVVVSYILKRYQRISRKMSESVEKKTLDGVYDI